jgi:prenyltransferase beta subunit
MTRQVFIMNLFIFYDCLDSPIKTQTGAFGAHPEHDAHLLSTLSAIQILVMQDALDRVDIDRVVKWASSLQLVCPS